MNKYKVKVTQTKIGYVELFADNEEAAMSKIYSQGVFDSTIQIIDEDIYVHGAEEIM